MKTTPIPPEIIKRLKDALGPRGWIGDPQTMAGYLTDWEGRFRAATPLVVRPGSTEEVAAVARICHAGRVGMVPQGGNTGLVGGSVPGERGNQILLSLTRMNQLRDLDASNLTATVEAGCILATLKTQVASAGLTFPLSLAAEQSCHIGGNLATNAGGTMTLRYGNARDLVLGLEVVLANGEIWNGLRRLRKDNAGYDMKQIFLGSEGTLGIITAAVLRLVPEDRHKEVAIVAVGDVDAGIQLLAGIRAMVGAAVNAFEYFDRTSLDLVLRYIPHTREPMATRHSHYVLVELASSGADPGLRRMLESCLQRGYERGHVWDASLATSRGQAAEFWRLRGAIPEAQRRAGGVIKHDISVSVSRVPQLLERATEAVSEDIEGVRIAAFGHLGDGNIHFNLSQPVGMRREAFMARADTVNRRVYDLVMDLEGSFSAEHGVGQLKRSELRRYRSPVELKLMRGLKRALDPHNLLNPGKVL